MCLFSYLLSECENVALFHFLCDRMNLYLGREPACILPRLVLNIDTSVLCTQPGMVLCYIKSDVTLRVKS